MLPRALALDEARVRSLGRPLRATAIRRSGRLRRRKALRRQGRIERRRALRRLAPLRRTAVSPASDAQRAKVADKACLVCRKRPVDPAHLVRAARPSGSPLEDKFLQRAVVEVLNAIYKQDFLGFSYGFRRDAVEGRWSGGDAFRGGSPRRGVHGGQSSRFAQVEVGKEPAEPAWG